MRERRNGGRMSYRSLSDFELSYEANVEDAGHGHLLLRGYGVSRLFDVYLMVTAHVVPCPSAGVAIVVEYRGTRVPPHVPRSTGTASLTFDRSGESRQFVRQISWHASGCASVEFSGGSDKTHCIRAVVTAILSSFHRGRALRMLWLPLSVCRRFNVPSDVVWFVLLPAIWGAAHSAFGRGMDAPTARFQLREAAAHDAVKEELALVPRGGDASRLTLQRCALRFVDRVV